MTLVEMSMTINDYFILWQFQSIEKLNNVTLFMQITIRILISIVYYYIYMIVLIDSNKYLISTSHHTGVHCL